MPRTTDPRYAVISAADRLTSAMIDRDDTQEAFDVEMARTGNVSPDHPLALGKVRAGERYNAALVAYRRARAAARLAEVK